MFVPADAEIIISKAAYLIDCTTKQKYLIDELISENQTVRLNEADALLNTIEIPFHKAFSGYDFYSCDNNILYLSSIY